jgi:hypothetical protein
LGSSRVLPPAQRKKGLIGCEISGGAAGGFRVAGCAYASAFIDLDNDYSPFDTLSGMGSWACQPWQRVVSRGERCFETPIASKPAEFNLKAADDGTLCVVEATWKA